MAFERVIRVHGESINGPDYADTPHVKLSTGRKKHAPHATIIVLNQKAAEVLGGVGNRVDVLFDADRNLVGLKPSNEGNKIGKPPGRSLCPTIFTLGLVHCGILKSRDPRILVFDKDADMWVFSVADCLENAREEGGGSGAPTGGPAPKGQD